MERSPGGQDLIGKRSLKAISPRWTGPNAAFWRELSAAYPNAKAVLTTRSPESWYKSSLETILKLNFSSR